MDTQSNVEIFDEESIIQLYDEQNKALDFIEIASVEFEGKFYELLKPVEPFDGIGEDEAVILEYEVDEESDEKQFKTIFDEDLMEKVFEQYLKAVSDEDFAAGCGCGCDGENCDGDCDCDGDDCNCDDEKCDCHHKN